MSSTDLLHAGTSCSHPACRTIDFLPFKCSHCTHSFCTEHWQPTQHDCPKYDPAQYDRIVPQCPFCSKPVNVTPGQDVNAAMERHIDNDCHVFVGKKKRGPVCENKKCGKSLISPIICQVSIRSSCVKLLLIMQFSLARASSAQLIECQTRIHVSHQPQQALHQSKLHNLPPELLP